MTLTDTEKRAVNAAGELAGLLAEIVGHGRTRQNDLNELIHHVHAIQHAVLSQAAGRIYPDTYRLLGESFDPEGETFVTLLVPLEGEQ